MSYRIAVGGFMHETNTFQPQKTTWADFAEAADRPPLTRGPAVLTRFAGMNTGIEGAMKVLRAAGAELVPLLWTSTTPSGYVTRDAFERIADMLVADLKAALPVDAVYMSLHGAMVAEHLEDAEGEVLRRLRAVLGPKVPLIASLDLHCNTTAQKAEQSDGLVAYVTYPHVDMAETGEKAARLMLETLRRGRMPAKAFRQIPFVIPITWQCTTIEPARSIYAAMAKEVAGDVASLSFTPGFPAADIRDCGPAVLAYGWSQPAVDRAADRIAALVTAHERDFAGKLYDPDSAVREAMARAAKARKPILLADTQDNPGAGGSSDTVGLLAALLRHDPPGAVLGVLHDPAAAAKAHEAGIGKRIVAGLGGRSGYDPGPIEAEWTVERLGDGNFKCYGPMLDGWDMRIGPCALLRRGNVGVVVSSKKMQALDQAPFRHVGIEPKEQRILGLKSSVHFRADFEPLADSVLVVEAPGAMVADPAKLPFTRLRPDIRINPLGPTFAAHRQARPG
ncbi:MAG: M81 family metallopeptidase [Alphaproteobacteria bacterium]|nr:M81 family metallopeptidase [Alphaproteobacteria bacterium]